MIKKLITFPTNSRKLLRGSFQLREREYRWAWEFLSDCTRILDVGCGTGTFLKKAPERIVGIDLNPENVAYCQAAKLDARPGSALKIPFPDNTFEGLLCSHVMQVFHPDQAICFLREASRVVKPGGVVVLSNLTDSARFFQHPEVVKPYPPDALWSLCNQIRIGATSPMYAAPPPLVQEAIRLRYAPLLDIQSRTDPVLEGRCQSLRLLQLRFWIVNPFSYDAYTVKLRNQKAADAPPAQSAAAYSG